MDSGISVCLPGLWSFESRALLPPYAARVFIVNWYNRAAANAMGVALQYDVGFQRQCWHIHQLTHWMGDHAWIREANAQYRRFVFHGDVIRMDGEVVEKFVADNAEACVWVRTWSRNQRGEEVMPGGAVIALPRRGDASPAERRLRWSAVRGSEP